MRDLNHYRNLLDQNPTATVGFTLAASMVYAARFGFCEAEHHSTPEWGNIARRLKAQHGENLTVDEVRAEMESDAEIDERESAVGRPPAAGSGRQVRISATVPPEFKKWVESRGDVSAQIRDMIEQAMRDA